MSRSNKLPKDPVQANITALTHEGRGIAHINGKAVFIRNALAGESVLFTYTKKHRQYDEGIVTQVLVPSENRVTPECQHFGICGGCNLQHLAHPAQVSHKQQVLLEQLKHIGKITPQHVLDPLVGPPWGYRHKARLGVKYVRQKEKVLIGFREINGRFLADLDRCPVLHPAVGERFIALRTLIADLTIYEHIPQIEIAVGEGENEVAMIFRHLMPFTSTDITKLRDFARAENIMLALQPGNADTIHYLWPPEGGDLHYSLPHHQIKMHFKASDFTQINPFINRLMIDHVLNLLALTTKDQVLDLFCGLGNFTLPIAKQCKTVVGVEGAPDLVTRAQANAMDNGISNARFYAADLTQDLMGQTWAKETFDVILLDPPRTGALEMMAYLPRFKAKKIVYVSCNPATLARDSKILCEQGYTLSSAGIIDMFPHTGHVESVTVFEL